MDEFTVTCHIADRRSGLSAVYAATSEYLHTAKDRFGEPIPRWFSSTKEALDFIDKQGRHHEHAHTLNNQQHGHLVTSRRLVA